MAGFTEVAKDVFGWTDDCNVFVIREGEAAILIDLGDGNVLDALNQIGVKEVEWVLFTHHHREQCHGAGRLRERGIKVAVPEAERALFEQPTSFRKIRPSLGDAFAVHGASYVRPPIGPIAVDRTFARMDSFGWRDRELVCVHTGGHSPGHMAFILPTKDGRLGFTGDLMLDGAKMHTWYDSEFDYGFAKGLFELANNSAQIAGHDLALMLPAHGPIIRNPREQLAAYVLKLKQLGALYVRGYDINRFANCDQDEVSRPTAVPHLWQVSPHLYKFRGPDYWVNFHMILADSGHALLVDCGLFDRAFLDRTLDLARERLGLKAIDAVFVTHMHGDHALDADHVRRRWGARLWAMEGVVDKFERAWDHDFCALLPSYNDRGKPDALVPLAFDRTLKDGEVVPWEGLTLVCDWMPGQTKYHSCLHGEIDGLRVAFTGDNLFAGTADPAQGGNEAVVARNGGALEEGYLFAARYLHDLAPDLLLGGHCWAMKEPKGVIERLRIRMEALRAAFTALSVDDDYRYMFDPYWVRAAPYRVMIPRAGSAEVTIHVRNYRPSPQSHRVTIQTPPGLKAEPDTFEGACERSGSSSRTVRLKAEAGTPDGLHLVAIDVQRDGQRLGPMFDCIAWVGSTPEDVARTAGSPNPETY